MQKILSYLNNGKTAYIFLLCLVILDRIFLLTNFNFKYVGSDELIFWQSANDYMNGVFHEPYFYGQAYNFMLESFFAIPLLKLGVPYHYAFPIATSILSLFPFFLFSIVLRKKGFVVESMFFLLIPLLLPIEYGILNSITRGFVTGLFFSGFFIFALLEPLKKHSWIIATISLGLGYIFNPNSLIFSFPICIYLFFNNYKGFSFYWISILSLVPILLIEFFAKRFYTKNPEYIVHGSGDFSFSFSQVVENFSFLDKFYSYFTPLFWSMGWLIVFVILITGIFYLKKDWKKGVSIILGVLLIIAALGIKKVNDHYDTIFISSTRMFLGIPLFTGLVFFWCKSMFKVSDKNFKYGLVIIAVSLFCVKMSLFTKTIKYHTTKTNYGPIAIKKIKDLSCECEEIEKLASKYKIDLIVFHPSWELNVAAMEFYNYGCPLMRKSFPKAFMDTYEKRTWVYKKEESAIEKNVMIYGHRDSSTVKTIGNTEIISDPPPIIVVKDNQLKTRDLLKLFNIELKRK